MAKIGIIAIHGGDIEPGTTEIAQKIAGGNFPLFVNEQGPHISSTEFNTDVFQDFIENIGILISIHGEKSMTDSFVMIGGLHGELRKSVEKNLHRSGFRIKIPSENLKGTNPQNVCNRGKNGGGVQIEISRKLRDELVQNKDFLESFSQAVRSALP